MKGRFFPLPLALAAVCLWFTVGLSRLVAQASTAPVVPGSAVPDPSSSIRTYTGTAVQTTAAGVTTSSTFTLLYYKGGRVSASFTYEGLAAGYSAKLVPAPALAPIFVYDNSDNLVPEQVKNVGLLTGAASPLSGGPGDPVPAFIALLPPLPLFVSKTLVYGGMQNADGSSLTFRATRAAK